MDEHKGTSRTHSTTVNRDSQFLYRKILADFFILCCVGFFVFVFYLWGRPYERGFFCDDESLRHPYKDSTITNIMLYVVGVGLPVVSMMLNEWLRLRNYKGSRPRLLFGKEIPAWLVEAYKVVGVFLFGCMCQQLTTDVAKYTIGRLRPHFFDVCKPDINCDDPSNKYRYIESFTCRGTDERLLKEMRLSFPSGHSSFSAYSMIYFAMYLQKRFTFRIKLLRHSLQFVLFLFAWYTAMSRVSDYKHHWSDVLAGFSIGSLYAIVVFAFISTIGKTVRIRHHQESELRATNGNTRNGPGWQV